jgi:predicted amidohydrolase
MREPLRIAVAQPVCVRHDVAGNAVRHARVVRSARARVVVFPELSLTGYELDAASIAADYRVWVAVASFAGSTGEGYDRTAGCSGIWTSDGGVLA